MPFHGLDLNLLITIDASDGERSRTAAGLMGSSDDMRFASRPSICKASHAGRRSVLEQRTSSFGQKVSLLRAPITGATVMAKRGYAQLENAITRPSCRAFLFLTFIKSPRRFGKNCSTAGQSKNGVT